MTALAWLFAWAIIGIDLVLGVMLVVGARASRAPRAEWPAVWLTSALFWTNAALLGILLWR